MKIGLPRLTYAEKRCVIKKDNTNNFKNMKLLDGYMYYKCLLKKLGLDDKIWFFFPLTSYGIDIYHTFNYVCRTKKPWVCTFETVIPRVDDSLVKRYKKNGDVFYVWNKKVDYFLSLIAKKNCKAIISLSQSNSEIQKKFLEAYPAYKLQIEGKLNFIHPPQKVINAQRTQQEFENPKVNFIFVGKDFYRKGGSEIVLAFDELVNEGLCSSENINLTLIGNKNNQENITHSNYQDDESYFDKIDKLIESSNYISYYDSLPNNEVVSKIKNSHVGLLPTWSDTYGYSVLEFFAAGCPVISTNVRALSEINSSDRGYLINLPLNNIGELYIDSWLQKEKVRRYIIDRIKEHVLSVLNKREALYCKSKKSVEYIINNHDPDAYFKKISSYYSL